MSVTTEDDLAMLAETARSWVTETCPALPDHHAARAAAPALWNAMAEMGWAGAAVAEADGGAGFGLAGFGTLLTALGRELVPSPLLSSGLLATHAIGRGLTGARRAELLGKIASGEITCAVAIDEWARHDPERIETRAQPQADGGWKLTGAKRYVAGAVDADLLLVAARDDAGPSLFLVDAKPLAIQPLDTIDGRAFGHVTLDGAAVAPGDRLSNDGSALIEELCTLGRLGLASEMLGAAERALEITVDYLKVREQFGRPIGTFQALQHRAAQVHVDVELARSSVAAAWRAAELEDPRLGELALIAKYAAGEALHLASLEIVQLHGGIGMTVEHVAGRYLKWARVSEAMYGSASELADRYATLKGF